MASGGGGEPLPPFGFDQSAGRSRIGGCSYILPRLALDEKGKPKFPPGTGPLDLETLHPISCPTAVRTGSLVAWAGNVSQHRSQPARELDQQQEQQYHGRFEENTSSSRAVTEEQEVEAETEGKGKGNAVVRKPEDGPKVADTRSGVWDENNRRQRRDYQAELAALESAREEARIREEAQARREGRLPNSWCSHPSRVVPIMQNNKPIDPKKGQTPWVP
jgi:hypothetical protein